MVAHEEEAGGCGEDGSGPNRACEVKAAQDRRRTADLSCSLMSLEQVGAGRSPPEVCVLPASSCFSLFFSIDF